MGDASLRRRRRRLASLTVWQRVVHIETSSKTAHLSLLTLRTRWIRASPNRQAKCPVFDCAWTPKVTFSSFAGGHASAQTRSFGASHPESLRHIIFPMATINYMIKWVSSRSNVQLISWGGIISEPRLNHEFVAGRTPASSSDGVTVAVASEAGGLVASARLFCLLQGARPEILDRRPANAPLLWD